MSETIEKIIEYQKLYNERLYLVASENSPSINARLSFLTDIFNRYYFPLEEHRSWAFPGNEVLEALHDHCRSYLRKLTGARFVDIKPISGVNCMTVALASLTRPGDTIASISPLNGGHHITRFIAERFGCRVIYLPYEQGSFTFNFDSLEKVIEKEVSLIYLDQAHILFPFNLEEVRSRIPETTKIYYDGSHVMGLIFGSNFQKPLQEGASFLGGSTHKTIPGPHKGFIATNDIGSYQNIERTSKNFVSHDHGADVAALAVILEEMDGKWYDYATRIVENAQYLAALLDGYGFAVAAKEFGFTKSHQIWVNTVQFMDAFEAVKVLARCGIIVNSISAPAFPNQLALRIGVQEVTYLGATKEVMAHIAEIFERVLIKKSYSEAKVRSEVAEIKKKLLPAVDNRYLERVLNSLEIGSHRF